MRRCARQLELPAHLCSLAPAGLRPAATVLQELKLGDTLKGERVLPDRDRIFTAARALERSVQPLTRWTAPPSPAGLRASPSEIGSTQTDPVQGPVLCSVSSRFQ